MIHVCMMHVSMILDPDSCVYDTCIYDPWPWCMYVWCGVALIYLWCIHQWSLILMHVCMMHVSMIIDPHACVFDACMMPISMMQLKFCLERTDGQADSRSWKVILLWRSNSWVTWSTISYRIPFSEIFIPLRTPAFSLDCSHTTMGRNWSGYTVVDHGTLLYGIQYHCYD